MFELDIKAFLTDQPIVDIVLNVLIVILALLDVPTLQIGIVVGIGLPVVFKNGVNFLVQQLVANFYNQIVLGEKHLPEHSLILFHFFSFWRHITFTVILGSLFGLTHRLVLIGFGLRGSAATAGFLKEVLFVVLNQEEERLRFCFFISELKDFIRVCLSFRAIFRST